MSKFMEIMLGAARSNTIQANGLFLLIWTAVLNSEMVQSNPEYAAIMGGVQALVNVLLRFKTVKPLSER